MVNQSKPSAHQLDPVAAVLTRMGEPSSSVIDWLNSQREFTRMRRRATWCAVSAWLMLTAAAIVSSLVAVSMSGNIRRIFDDQYRADSWSILMISYAPWLLVTTAGALLVVGVIGFTSGQMPGLKSTISAIDWSSACDAVGRLLSIGCSYPEAFRTAAQSMRRSESRHWLLAAVDRVESGRPPIDARFATRGDVAVLELMIEAAESQPQNQWQLASLHFLDVARRRLVLLTHSIPMITTLLAGFLIWISISTTLGWMWRTVGSLVQGFGY